MLNVRAPLFSQLQPSRLVLDLCNDEMVSPKQLCTRWGYSDPKLCHMRRMGIGVPFVKLATGAIRYRQSDVLAAEKRSFDRSLRVEEICDALAECKALTAIMRATAQGHLRRAFKLLTEAPVRKKQSATGKHRVYGTNIAAFSSMFDCISDQLVVPVELSDHWHLSKSSLNGARCEAQGIPFIKIATAVRYRLRDVLASEIEGTTGPLTLERVCFALSACADLGDDDREIAQAHVREVFAGELPKLEVEVASEDVEIVDIVSLSRTVSAPHLLSLLEILTVFGRVKSGGSLILDGRNWRASTAQRALKETYGLRAFERGNGAWLQLRVFDRQRFSKWVEDSRV